MGLTIVLKRMPGGQFTAYQTVIHKE